jgi:hypothetical protein
VLKIERSAQILQSVWKPDKRCVALATKPFSISVARDAVLPQRALTLDSADGAERESDAGRRLRCSSLGLGARSFATVLVTMDCWFISQLECNRILRSDKIGRDTRQGAVAMDATLQWWIPHMWGIPLRDLLLDCA